LLLAVLCQVTNSVSEAPLISFDDVDSGEFRLQTTFFVLALLSFALIFPSYPCIG